MAQSLASLKTLEVVAYNVPHMIHSRCRLQPTLTLVDVAINLQKPNLHNPTTKFNKIATSLYYILKCLNKYLHIKICLEDRVYLLNLI
jgi:hypothetical protein